jgi:hypothetical protein
MSMSSGVSRQHVAVEQHHPPGTANIARPQDAPQSPTNDWLSYGFFRSKNDQEKALQKQAADYYEQHPHRGTSLQLEHIYRALTYLNALAQFRESRDIPGQFRTYTVRLNLFGQAQGGAMDQIIPYNANRKRVTLYATQSSAYISNKIIQTINPGGSVGSTPSFTNFVPLAVNEYFFLPEEQRWPIDSNAAVYGVGVSVDTACILTLVEELYNAPSNLKKEYLISKHDDAATVQKSDWLEDIEAKAGTNGQAHPLPHMGGF